jgi:alpha-galactosidase/6-phospho-beta-glucosidase family protein
MEGFNVGVHGTFIVDVAMSLAYDRRERFLLMVENNGAIPNLPADAMVEIPAYVTSRGPEPIRMEPIELFYKGLIEQQLASEKLLVEAALEGSYQKALQAFSLNKTFPSAEVAKTVLDELIEANKKYWPALA